MDSTFLSHEDAALRNRNIILHYIRKNSPISRTEIWERNNMSRASVTMIIRQLVDKRLVTEVGEGVSKGGRKPTIIAFNGNAEKIYAFDWTSKVLALVDMNANILFEESINIGQGMSSKDFSSVVMKAIDSIDRKKICAREEIIGFGIALPGIIDSRRSTVIYSTELGWENVDVSDLFSDRFGGNVYLERTGNIMLIGANTEDSNHAQLFILSSNGIGVSGIVRNNCQHGTNSMYGELGHIKMKSNVKCSCGQRGCIEAVINDLFTKAGNTISEEVIEYLAIAVSTSLNITDAGKAILVGSFVDAMTETQKSELTKRIKDNLQGGRFRKIDISYSENMKQLAFIGLSSYAFGQYYPVD